jgi:Ca-activated chloride channel homolog
VWGGGSFNDAAALPGAGRYLDKIAYNDYTLYKIWLEWGQGLSYQVRFQSSENVGTTTAVTEWRGPDRSSSREHAWTSTDYEGSAVPLKPLATPQIRYANRAGDDRIRHAARAGWYYLVVKPSPVWTDGSRVPAAQPVFELVVTIHGDRIAGPPYAARVDMEPAQLVRHHGRRGPSQRLVAGAVVGRRGLGAIALALAVTLGLRRRR